MKSQAYALKRFKLKLTIAAVALVWLASSLSPYGAESAQEPARPKGALALYWNGRDNPANTVFDKSIRAAIGKESVFYFREPTFWEEYKWWIIGSISLCAIQTLMIAALSLQRARRK